MADLSTSYMGIPLKNPVVVGACSLSSMIADIQRIEAAGAGALVIKSLFEEQVMLESKELEDETMTGAYRYAESITYYPEIEAAGPRGHLMWVEKTRRAVALPLIASLNAVRPGTWAAYAKQLESTGVNALELNVYSVQTDPNRSAAEIEKDLLETVQQVKSDVKIPVAVKLSPFYTSVANVAAQLDRIGVDGLVLFNRFLQPDIDIDKENLWNRMELSHRQEIRLPLRWVAILHGRVKADLAGSTGAHTSDSIIKYLLAGAQVAYVVSTLYQHGIEYIGTLLEGVNQWMEAKNYKKIEDFRGKLSQKDATDPFVFERAQYVDLLLKQKSIAKPAVNA